MTYYEGVNLILDLIFPKKCAGCRKFGSYFCSDCTENIKQTDLVCPTCERAAIGGQTHPICRRRFGLDGLWSLGVYQDPLRGAIKKLKYRGVKEVAVILINIILDYWVRYQPFLLDEIKKSLGKEWLVVPVPLHWYRQNSRGFNQSALVSQELAARMGLKYQEVLIRSRYTKSQVKLKGRERSQNIKNAFSLNTKYQIQNTNIILVDDVWTTGSTLRECCYILKRSGAKKVWALTLAR
jgi:competence protein ComFC